MSGRVWGAGLLAATLLAATAGGEARAWSLEEAAEPLKGTTIKALFLDRPGYAAAIKLLPEFEAPVVTLGRVVWCEQGPDSYEIGTEFWWIGWGDEGVQRSIGDYVRRALEKDGTA